MRSPVSVICYTAPLTGLSQKLPVCQPQNHRPAAVSGPDCSPDPLPPSPAAPAVRRLSSDEWGEFSGGPVLSNFAGSELPSDSPFAPSSGPPSAPPSVSPSNPPSAPPSVPPSVSAPPSVPPSAPPPELTDSANHAAITDTELPVTLDAPKSGAMCSPAVVGRDGRPRESSVFSDSDSDSENVDRLQPSVAEQRSSAGSLAEDSEDVTQAGVVSTEDIVPVGESDPVREESGKVTDDISALQNGTDVASKETDVADSEGDDFGDFGDLSAPTESGGWSEPVTNSVDTAATKLVRAGPPADGNDSQQDGNAPGPASKIEPHVPRSKSPVSETITPASNVEPLEDDFGGLMTSNGRQDQVNGDERIETSDSVAERVPSPDDFGDFSTPGEPLGSSVPVEDTNESIPTTGDGVTAGPVSDTVNTLSSKDRSHKRTKSPDDFGVPEKLADDKAPSDSFATPHGDHTAQNDDFGDFAGPTDDFGDFAAPSDDFGDFAAPSDDVGDFAAPSDDFGGFSAAGEGLAEAWPPDGTGGGGGGSAGFADFGAVFAAPEDGGSTAAPLDSAGQLADPDALSDDDFGDFEDFQAPVPKEPTPITDEVGTKLFCDPLASVETVRHSVVLKCNIFLLPWPLFSRYVPPYLITCVC